MTFRTCPITGEPATHWYVNALAEPSYINPAVIAERARYTPAMVRLRRELARFTVRRLWTDDIDPNSFGGAR